MPDGFQYWAEIIKQAAQSPLGVFALMILAISSIALAFFGKASERVRVGVFALMFAGVAVFGYAVLRIQRVPPPSPDGSPAEPKPGEQRRSARDGLPYVWIPQGEFRMGCTEDAEDDCFPAMNSPREVLPVGRRGSANGGALGIRRPRRPRGAALSER